MTDNRETDSLHWPLPLQVKRLENSLVLAKKQAETVSGDPFVKSHPEDPFNNVLPKFLERAEKRIKDLSNLQVRTLNCNHNSKF